MRHRAAMGISEHSDALTIIVSEQNGKISYTQNGKIKIGVSEKQLTNYLNKQFNSKKES
jgi:diadenylate cyclase